MNRLEAQKRLLLAESDLNRAQLASELARLGRAFGAVAGGAARAETLSSTVLAVVAGFLGTGTAATGAPGKPSFFSLALLGGRLISMVWRACASRRPS